MTTTAPPRQPFSRHGALRNARPGVTELHLYSEIGEWGVTARQFLDDLGTAKGGPVALYVNSPGGDLFEGVAIYNALRKHPAPVVVHIDGLATSIASIIALGADQRIIAPNAQVMVHDALTVTAGDEAAHLRTAELLSQCSNSLAQIYAERTGQGTPESWRATMRSVRWLSAEESVAAGLATSIPATEGEATQLHGASPTGIID